jgi:hypothetical protein
MYICLLWWCLHVYMSPLMIISMGMISKSLQAESNEACFIFSVQRKRFLIENKYIILTNLFIFRSHFWRRYSWNYSIQVEIGCPDHSWRFRPHLSLFLQKLSQLAASSPQENAIGQHIVTLSQKALADSHLTEESLKVVDIPEPDDQNTGIPTAPAPSYSHRRSPVIYTKKSCQKVIYWSATGILWPEDWESNIIFYFLPT